MKTDAPQQPATVLLVEDDPAHAELLCRALKDDSDFQLIRLRNGEEALNYLYRRTPFESESASPRPRLILLDLRLPKVDGLEVLREMKASPMLSDVPVVVLSTSDAQRDLSAAYLAHANSYVVKPDEFEQLRELMADIKRYWLRWNHSSNLPC